MDFDLHGLVGVRCVDATPADVEVVARQLGPLAAALERDPDIEIRFVERLRPSSPLRYLEVDDVAFSDDAFFVLRGRHKSRAMVQIPFDAIGGRCEMVCERGLAAIPLLIDVINATALARNHLPLHAAGFEYGGVGALVTGWSKGGKTEALLGFMSQGARYVGDEWIYLEDGGRRMFGIPEPIRVWSWHLEHLPLYRERLDRLRRWKLRALGAAAMSARWAADGPLRARRGFFARLQALVQRQMHVDWPPLDLFGPSALAPSGVPERIFFVVSHEHPEIHVEPISPAEVAERMLFSLEYERERFMTCYRKFRFAFPERANPLIDGARDLQRALLHKALEGRPAWAIRHPYPVEIPALYEAMRPLLR